MARNNLRLLILFAAYASISTPAQAYLDPATGSIAVQVVIGAVATWLMYSKIYAAKAKSFILKLVGRRGSPGPEKL